MSINYLTFNYLVFKGELAGKVTASDARDITGGALFVAGLIVAAAVTVLLYFVRARLAHRKCCSDARLEELNSSVGLYDPTTALHSSRVAELAKAVLEELGLPSAEQRIGFLAAQVHDIGKSAISGDVLLKPGPLTDEEWELMRAHPGIGADILEQQGFCSDVVRIVRHHHERWDGAGYPAGLVGHQIPLGARVLAVVDGFDAMTNDRPYRSAMRLQDAVYSLRAGSGTQWDPEVVEAFLRLGIPPMYLQTASLFGGMSVTGRAGRRLGVGTRSLARSAAASVL